MGPFVFTPSATLSYAYDDNVFRVEDGFVTRNQVCQGGTCVERKTVLRPTADSLSTASASLGLKLPFSHSFASLVWTPRYADYRSATLPLKTSNQVVFETALSFSNSSRIHFQDDFVRGYAQSSEFDPAHIIQFTSTPYRRNASHLDYDWVFGGAWGLSGSVEHTGFTFDRVDVVDYYDYASTSVELKGYRNFARLQIYGSARFGRTDQDRTKYNQSHPDLATPGIPREQIDESDYGVGVEGSLLPNTQGDVRIGYVSWSFQHESSQPYAGISLKARVEDRLGERTLLVLQALREPVPSAVQSVGYFLRQEMSLQIESELTMRLQVRGGVLLRRNEFPAANGAASFTLRDVNPMLGLRYRASQGDRPGPLSLDLLYAPEHRTSDLAGENIDGSRLTLTLQYGWF